MHAAYKTPSELPATIPVFPLPGALLLPRGQMPLNIFEPRYLAMVDDALKSDRLIGMIQPETEDAGTRTKLYDVGCIGRLTQFAETGDGRYLIQLTGVSRFRVVEELSCLTAYRQCRIDAERYAADFVPRAGEEDVDREALVSTLRAYLDASNLQADWDAIRAAPNEALVNALAMMTPFEPREKQALLEAESLRARADMLVAMTEMELAKRASGTDTPIQ